MLLHVYIIGTTLEKHYACVNLAHHSNASAAPLAEAKKGGYGDVTWEGHKRYEEELK